MEFCMSDAAKAWINRIGLAAIIVGIIGIVTTGGDAQAAVDQGFSVAAIAGTVIVAIKEIIQSLIKK